MELFIKNIPYSTDSYQLTRILAETLHSQQFSEYNQGALCNFRVHIFPRRKNQPAAQQHGGCGRVILPRAEIAIKLLETTANDPIIIQTRLLKLSPGKKAVSKEVAESLQDEPYQDPETVHKHKGLWKYLQEEIPLISVQFLWPCQDGSFSIEWNSSFEIWVAEFDLEERRLVVKMENTLIIISIKSIHSAQQFEKSVILSLDILPTFERITHGRGDERMSRERLSYLDERHAWSAQYLKIVCLTFSDFSLLQEFARKAKNLGKSILYNPDFRSTPGSLFSQENLVKFDIWLKDLDYEVAFQLEALLTQGLFVPSDLMTLDLPIRKLKGRFKVHLIAAAIRAIAQYHYEDPESAIESLFERSTQALRDTTRQPTPPKDTSVIQCHRVRFTPIAKVLEGPKKDQSNRVLRRYIDYQHYFLRVEFREEDRFHYKWDKKVDGPKFIQERFGEVLRDGFYAAGRKFDFLAYSQSGLKDHAVWFVTPFYSKKKRRMINAEYIRDSLGDFTKVIFYPARYGARISQAFSTTDPSSIRPERIETLLDRTAEDGSLFTDGVGIISPQMADDIWNSLGKIKSKRGSHRLEVPSVYQIRIGGHKGTLCVDHDLEGRIICTRESMNKFDAPEDREIEVCQAFDHPIPFVLNRPLIMLLETLGVGHERFMELQEDAIQKTTGDAKSLRSAARLFEKNGLGTAFHLAPLFLHLDRSEIGHSDAPSDPVMEFLGRVIKFGVNHILREYKYKSRIPVPGSYQLVGVADEWDYLKANEIYACIQQPGSKKEYISGPILISRSPTVHPGDARMVHAVGEPPSNAPSSLRELVNCVVFSCKGKRSLPSMLAGGDLDGDIYALVRDQRLFPRKNDKPADYPRPKLFKIDRPATGVDIADFVAKCMINDILGIIATEIMLIADIKDDCMRHRDCIVLAELHSKAVDFPKTGFPVTINSLPRRERNNLNEPPKLPDWFAGEENVKEDSARYYESQRTIGKLFRAIELPAVPEANKVAKAQSKRLKKGKAIERETTIEQIHRTRINTPITRVLKRTLSRHIELRTIEKEAVVIDILNLFDAYSLRLNYICKTYSLSKSIALTEEEAVAGTIVRKCLQTRMRSDMIAEMREEADNLCSAIRGDIIGSEDTTEEESLLRAWIAWKASLTLELTFGARSFGLLALQVAFDMHRRIVQERS